MTRPPTPTMASTRTVLKGFGQTAGSAADVVPVGRATDVDAVVARAGAEGRPVVARGLGRSYGDAAQCAGGLVVDTSGLDAILDSDSDTGAGWVRAGAGVSLDTLMRTFLPRGWFVPVSPGTRQVTVGGAVAADIHGKNHHGAGSFCSHVRELSLATPTGRHQTGPDLDPGLFWATAGGMGLTGIVVEATVALLAVETSTMVVDTERTDDLDDAMAAMAARDHEYRYSVAWIDCLARGSHLGRAVLTRGDHARRSDLPAGRRAGALDFAPGRPVTVPVTPPSGLLSPLTVAAFNQAWYRKTPRRRTGQLQSLASFFHPLDGVDHWNRLYGPRGFVQYQCVVPDRAGDTIREIVERVSTARVASFLGVLKRFGPGNPGPLSFPMAGWTLALDLPVGSAGLGPLLDGLDTLVVEAGGRVYLAKDARLRPDVLAAMYPELEAWQSVRRRVDPDGIFVSDLAWRLGLAKEQP